MSNITLQDLNAEIARKDIELDDLKKKYKNIVSLHTDLKQQKGVTQVCSLTYVASTNCLLISMAH